LSIRGFKGPSSSNLGGTILAGSAADFAKLIVDETEKMGQGGQVLQAINNKPQ